jgi:hypothetical protein
MKVEVWLKKTSLPLKFDASANAYTKGEMYCIIQGKEVIKIPIINILYIKEEYIQHLHNTKGDD